MSIRFLERSQEEDLSRQKISKRKSFLKRRLNSRVITMMILATGMKRMKNLITLLLVSRMKASHQVVFLTVLLIRNLKMTPCKVRM